MLRILDRDDRMAGPAVADRVDRRLRKRLRIDIPLVGEPRLDHRARTVAEWRGDHPLLDLFESAFLLQQLDNALARLEAVEAEQFVGNPAALHDARLRIEHVEHLGGLESGALADFEIVEVVARGDLDRA